ncbi:MAG: hypothetical protein HYS86_02225 [Candidatus Chisholmbacteria bacterium]|nr:hypothetical protein [Candidatus Chisholmbacteria bacterium]
MYDYAFTFYKPNKTFFEPGELTRTVSFLQRDGYEVEFRSPPLATTKEGQPLFRPKEEEIGAIIRKGGVELNLFASAAEGPMGAIADLSITEDDLKESVTQNTSLLTQAAMIVFKGLQPLFAWGDHELELDKLQPFLSFDKIGALAWANLFSQELTEHLGGIDQVLLHPTWQKEQKQAKLTLGALSLVLITLSPSPADPVHATTALQCDRRYPGAIIKSFQTLSLAEARNIVNE